MENKKILFVCYGGGHAAMCAPLIKELESNDKYQLTVLAMNTAFDYLTNLDIECISYAALTHLSVTGDWESYGVQTIGKPEDYSGLLPYKESLAYYGINCADLVDQLGKKNAETKYIGGSRQDFYPIRFMCKLLKEICPTLVIATNAPRSERAAIDASYLLGIKSICLVDLFAFEEHKWIARKNFSTKVLVLNDNVKSFLVSKGRDEKDIEVTGNPAFDSIFNHKILEISENLSIKKYNKRKINILYASNSEPPKHPFNGKVGDVNLPVINENMLRDFVKVNNGYRLIVRYHPSQNVVFKHSTNVLLSPPDENVHAMLHCMDIVVTAASTVGLEGYLAGKKVISIDTSIFSEDVKYSSFGISYGVKVKGRLYSALHELSRNFKQEIHEQDRPDLATPKIYNIIQNFLLNA